jgi:hypothetical protein
MMSGNVGMRGWYMPEVRNVMLERDVDIPGVVFEVGIREGQEALGFAFKAAN